VPHQVPSCFIFIWASECLCRCWVMYAFSQLVKMWLQLPHILSFLLLQACTISRHRSSLYFHTFNNVNCISAQRVCVRTPSEVLPLENCFIRMFWGDLTSSSVFIVFCAGAIFFCFYFESRSHTSVQEMQTCLILKL
jgi:hypothetical protein